MTRRVASWLALVLGLGGLSGLEAPAGAARAEGAGRGHAPQLVFLAWDGAGDWVVDRLLAEGEMPHLAALAAAGARAEYSVTSFPSKTASGHAYVLAPPRLDTGPPSRYPALVTDFQLMGSVTVPGALRAARVAFSR